uniref:Uncharacterized protein n=1 Tax=Lotharella globosa TaxID=91324 RepID=A0A7S3YI30_9EUKA
MKSEIEAACVVRTYLGMYVFCGAEKRRNILFPHRPNALCAVTSLFAVTCDEENKQCCIEHVYTFSDMMERHTFSATTTPRGAMHTPKVLFLGGGMHVFLHFSFAAGCEGEPCEVEDDAHARHRVAEKQRRDEPLKEKQSDHRQTTESNEASEGEEIRFARQGEHDEPCLEHNSSRFLEGHGAC